MKKSDFEDYERRNRLYHTAFEEYNSLATTYKKFYKASDAFQKRGLFLTYTSTLFGGVLLFVIGAVLARGGPGWGTELAFGISVIVAGLSFINAVDNPQKASNVAYNSGQTLQRVFFEFHYFVTVRLPDPDEDLTELEEEYQRLLERKNTVNETTPALGSKWYHRVKEDDKSWEPKSLLEVTGEDGEFEKEEDKQDQTRVNKIARSIRVPLKKIKRGVGY